MVRSLKRKHLISENCEELLQRAFSGIPLEIMKHILRQKSKIPPHAS